MPHPVHSVVQHVWRDGSRNEGTRQIPEETALALTYNGGTYAVMMGTPQNLQDFSVGFSLTEGIVQSADDIGSIDIVELDNGIELRMWLAASRVESINARRRKIAGPTGCGICGIESIAEAVRPAVVVASGRTFSPCEIMAALSAIAPLQAIHIRTRAVHAAALWAPSRGIVALREDVGRHNALDKLAGALARETVAASEGIVLLTSRVSVEMVQKAAAMGRRFWLRCQRQPRWQSGWRMPPGSRSLRLRVQTALKCSPTRRGSKQISTPERQPMSPDRLIYMANQIGRFFRSQGHGQAVPGIAEHIQKFWDPRMRKSIFAHLDNGGAGLDPEVREAIATLKKS